MSVESYQQLCDRIDALENWHATAICATCITKVLPVIRRVSLPNTWNLVDECHKQVWESITKDAINSDLAELEKAVESTPEWECVDVYFLPSIVCEVLDFVRWGIQAAIDPSTSKENAKGAISHIASVASSYDAMAESFIARESNRKRTLDVQIEEMDDISQKKIIEVLDGTNTASEGVILELKRESQQIADLFEQLLPMVCYEHAAKES